MSVWLLPACFLAGAFDMNPENNAVKLPYRLIVSGLHCDATAAVADPATQQLLLSRYMQWHALWQPFAVVISQNCFVLLQFRQQHRGFARSRWAGSASSKLSRHPGTASYS
jgi:hypothetical protein